MTRTALFAACALALVASVAQAQIVIDSRPVVTTYYAPAPVVTQYAPPVSAAPVVTYDVPTVAAAPVTTYYAPTTAYYAPTTAYYAPATTAYYAPATTTYYAGTAVVTPVVGRPVTFGSSAYGTFRPYVPGQPVRNTFRFFVP